MGLGDLFFHHHPAIHVDGVGGPPDADLRDPPGAPGRAKAGRSMRSAISRRIENRSGGQDARRRVLSVNDIAQILQGGLGRVEYGRWIDGLEAADRGIDGPGLRNSACPRQHRDDREADNFYYPPLSHTGIIGPPRWHARVAGACECTLRDRFRPPKENEPDKSGEDYF